MLDITLGCGMWMAAASALEPGSRPIQAASMLFHPPAFALPFLESSSLGHWASLALPAVVVICVLLFVLLMRIRGQRKSTIEALRRKQSEIVETQRLAKLGTWHWNPKTDAVTWSEALYGLTGVNPARPAPAFDRLSHFFTPDSHKQLTESMERLLRNAETFELELLGTRPDGVEKWLIVRGEAMRDTDGYVELHGTMQDITERKHSEEVRLTYSAIVESSDDAIISKDLNGIILTWNAGAERIFGYSKVEAVGQSITILIPPELQDEEEMILRRLRAGERIDHYETIRISKAGKKLHLSLNISLVRDSTGRIVGVSKIARDIGPRKQAERDLKRADDMFSKAFRESPLPLTLTNASTHRYIDVNEAFESLSDYGRDEVIGRSALEIGIWADPRDRLRLSEQLRTNGTIREVECSFRSRDGREIVGLACAELIEFQGESCVLGVIADITDRKRAEQALIESERRFRLMADSAPVLMWLFGPDRLCTDVNREWLRFTGRTYQEELGDGWKQGIFPDDLSKCSSALARAFDARQSFTVEYRMRRHDHKYRWLQSNGVPRFLDNGDFAGFIGCCVDITDEKEAKIAQIEFSGRLIRAQEEERSRIARELHDDINQRLALLANGLQELGQSLADADGARQQLGELEQLTSEIATDLQHMSHELHPAKLHYLGLAAAVRDLCQSFSRQHKIPVECVVRELPGELNEAISLSLFRTVQESLHNVAKHSHANHVKVELTGGLGEVRLRISDDGAGFDPDLLSDSRGLGLTSMRERLRSVGGDFFIWSRPSLGTQVEGTVPTTVKPIHISQPVAFSHHL